MKTIQNNWALVGGWVLLIAGMASGQVLAAELKVKCEGIVLKRLANGESEKIFEEPGKTLALPGQSRFEADPYSFHMVVSQVGDYVVTAKSSVNSESELIIELHQATSAKDPDRFPMRFEPSAPLKFYRRIGFAAGSRNVAFATEHADRYFQFWCRTNGGN